MAPEITQRVKVAQAAPVKNEALESISRAKSKPYSLTVHWDELEEWQRDNEYIFYGYRRCVSTYTRRGCT